MPAADAGARLLETVASFLGGEQEAAAQRRAATRCPRQSTRRRSARREFASPTARARSPRPRRRCGAQRLARKVLQFNDGGATRWLWANEEESERGRSSKLSLSCCRSSRPPLSDGFTGTIVGICQGGEDDAPGEGAEGVEYQVEPEGASASVAWRASGVLLPRKTCVRFSGLVGAAHLNGRAGIITSANLPSRRYAVAYVVQEDDPKDLRGPRGQRWGRDGGSRGGGRRGVRVLSSVWFEVGEGTAPLAGTTDVARRVAATGIAAHEVPCWFVSFCALCASPCASLVSPTCSTHLYGPFQYASLPTPNLIGNWQLTSQLLYTNSQKIPNPQLLPIPDPIPNAQIANNATSKCNMRLLELSSPPPHRA